MPALTTRPSLTSQWYQSIRTACKVRLSLIVLGREMLGISLHLKSQTRRNQQVSIELYQ